MFCRSLSFCTFFVGHCAVCSSSFYGFRLPLWYLQSLLLVIISFRTMMSRVHFNRYFYLHIDISRYFFVVLYWGWLLGWSFRVVVVVGCWFVIYIHEYKLPISPRCLLPIDWWIYFLIDWWLTSTLVIFQLYLVVFPFVEKCSLFFINSQHDFRLRKECDFISKKRNRNTLFVILSAVVNL